MKSNKIVFLSITVFIVLLSSILTQAQFKKDDWLVEGSIGSITLTNDTDEYTQGTGTYKYENSGFSFNVYPRAGYFITNDIVIGTTLGFSYYNSDSEDYDALGNKQYESNYNSSSITFAPFLRYYLSGSANSNLRFYGQIGGGLNTYLSYERESTIFNNNGEVSSKTKYESPENYFSYNIVGLMGLNYFLAENVAINTAIGYNYSKSTETTQGTFTPSGGTPSESTPIEYKNTSGDLSWNIGFTMIIP